MKAAGEFERPGGRDENKRGWPAVYRFGGDDEPVRLLKVLRHGSVVVIRADGWLDVVRHDRVRLSREALP